MIAGVPPKHSALGGGKVRPADWGIVPRRGAETMYTV